MAERGGNGRPTAAAGLRDFLALGVRALAGGLVSAVTLGFAALVLAHNAQATGTARSDADVNKPLALYAGDPVAVAAAAPAFRETLVVSAQRDNEPGSVAPDSTGPIRPAEPGALWAKAIKAQGDNAATLLLVLGVFAIGAASTVAAIGRSARGTRA